MKKTMTARMKDVIGYVVYSGKTGNVCYDGGSLYEVGPDGKEKIPSKKTLMRARMHMLKLSRRGGIPVAKRMCLRDIQAANGMGILLGRTEARLSMQSTYRSDAQAVEEAQNAFEQAEEMHGSALTEGSPEDVEAARINKSAAYSRLGKATNKEKSTSKWLRSEIQNRKKRVATLSHAVQQSERARKAQRNVA